MDNKLFGNVKLVYAFNMTVTSTVSRFNELELSFTPLIIYFLFLSENFLTSRLLILDNLISNRINAICDKKLNKYLSTYLFILYIICFSVLTFMTHQLN